MPKKLSKKMTVLSDGFSTLASEEKRIIEDYGQGTMDAFNEHGYIHDARVEYGIEPAIAWILMVEEMIADPRIPAEEIQRQCSGLGIFDQMPNWMKWLSKRLTTKKPLKEVEVEI